MLPLSIFGATALWSPYFALSLVVLTVFYFLLTVKWRDRFEGSEPLKARERNYFIASMILLYIVKGSPMDLLGHILFSVHMAQMALLLLIVAPFMMIGIPNWMWRKVFAITPLAKFINLMTKPIVALLVFSLMFSLYHYPIVLDTVKLNVFLHAGFTITIFISALFLWWPLINTLEGQPQLHGLKKIGYVILSALLITPACTLIIFVDVPVYETYMTGEAWLQAMALCVPAGTLASLPPSITGPQLFTSMPALYDQQLGGIIMKIMQELIYVVVIGKIFITWYRDEQKNADVITQREIDERKKREELYHIN